MHEVEAAVVVGVPVDDVNFSEAVELIGSFVEEGRSTGRTFQVATINVDFVVNASKDPGVMAILQRADLCLADGMPILWHARLSGSRLRERVAGADLVPRLADLSRKTGWRIVLFGSADGVAEAAGCILRERYPGASVVGLSGPMLPDVRLMETRWIDEINALAPDIVCVALGNPKQERWIDAYRSALDASVYIGVGGTLDFLVGGRRRAPTWMQRSGLEWVYRASQEPGRLGRRYGRDALVFGPALARAAGRFLLGSNERRRLGPRSATPIRLRVSSDSEDRILDLTGVAPSDCLVVTMVGFARSCRRAGQELRVIGSSEAVRSRMSRLGVVKMFDLTS
jgi:N-acetylglucosaminyldiphosphoundecaprenol N-acetyl-beta-D-mannosaminyltransferase